MKRKNRFRKTLEYLCARRRILSFVVAVLSAAAAAGYVVYAGVCAFNIDKVKETMKGLWGFQFVASVGLYTLFSVLGIILFSVLGLYRALMCYFYYKLYRGSVDFYRERGKDIFLFSALSFVMAGVYFFLYYKDGVTMPYLGKGGSLTAAIIYLLFGGLPIAEKIVCDITVKIMKKESGAKVPKKDDIEEELETDADLSAMSLFGRTKGDIGVDCDYGNDRDCGNDCDCGNDRDDAKENLSVGKSSEYAAKKAEDKSAAKKVVAEEDITAEEERITKSYGRAAGRLARRMKEMDDEEDD